MLNYKMRPHHGLCLGFYGGKGYNKLFVQNMNQVMKKLKKETRVTLVIEEDIICIACPHNEEGKCEQHGKVNQYDQAVLNYCGLQINQEVTWKAFRDLIKSEILEKGRLKKICKECQWWEICSRKYSNSIK